MIAAGPISAPRGGRREQRRKLLTRVLIPSLAESLGHADPHGRAVFGQSSLEQHERVGIRTLC